MSFDLPFLKAAHAHSIFNHSEIVASSGCACFGCQRVFDAARIERWIAEGDGKEATAWCPYCDLDSVIGDKSGLPIANSAFLSAMHAHWCNADNLENEHE